MRDVPTIKANSAVDVGSSVAPPPRKSSMLLVALFILSVMVVWFGFLGWGMVALLGWAADWIVAGFPI